MNKEITVQEYLDAVRKNGLPQHFGALFKRAEDDEEKEIIAACAFGQGVLNLGLLHWWHQIKMTVLGDTIMRDTIRLNDGSGMPIPEIVNLLESRYEFQKTHIFARRISK